MTQSRRDLFHLPPLLAAPFILATHLLAGCAVDQVTIQKGDSGPIAWEVTDIRQSIEEQGNRMKWDYTLVLKNIGSTTVTFDQIRLVTMETSGEMSGGHDTRPFALTLKPGTEARYTNNSYSHGCRQTCDPQWVQQMFRKGVTRVMEFRGRDEAGRPVNPIIRLRLDSSVGSRAAVTPGIRAASVAAEPSPVLSRPRPGPTAVSADILPAPVREHGQIAGHWRALPFGSGSPPATGSIETNGQHTWRSGRNSPAGTLGVSADGRARFESSGGQRLSLALCEGHGRLG